MSVAAGAVAGIATAALGAAPTAHAAPIDESVLDSRVASLVNDPATLTHDAIAESPAVFHVEHFRRPGDASDFYCWDRALSAARAHRGPSVVRAAAREYVLSRVCSLSGLNSVVIEGAGPNQTILSGMLHQRINFAFGIGAGEQSASDLTIRNLGFRGSLTNAEALAGKLARDEREFVADWSATAGVTVTGSSGNRGLQTAIYISGSRLPGGIFPHVRNVTVENVSFFGLKQLPLMLYGIEGHVRVTGCTFERCLDVGFRSNHSVSFTLNRISWSADNGVSVSRANERVICSMNNIVGSYFNGVWVAGWEGEPGPAAVTVGANQIDLSGRHGIYFSGGAKSASITGNMVSNSRREREWWEGVGIYLEQLTDALVPDLDADGSDADERLTSTVTVASNTIVDCDRGGVLIGDNTANVAVVSNIVMRPGRPTKPGGGALDLEGGGDNFGISTPGSGSTTRNVIVSQNLIVDDRDGASAASATAMTPLARRREAPCLGAGVHRGTASSAWYSWDNTVIGAAIPHLEGVDRRVGNRPIVGYPHSYSPALVIDKAPGGVGALEFHTAGAPRWRMTSDTSSEAGGDTGSALRFESVGDDGVGHLAYEVRRADARVSFKAPLRVPAASTRPDAAAQGVGAVFYDGTLRKPIFSDGSRWRDAGGTVV